MFQERHSGGFRGAIPRLGVGKEDNLVEYNSRIGVKLSLPTRRVFPLLERCSMFEAGLPRDERPVP